MRTHYELTKYLGICGYFSDNLTQNNKQVDCKECLKIMKKERPEQYLKREYRPF